MVRRGPIEEWHVNGAPIMIRMLVLGIGPAKAFACLCAERIAAHQVPKRQSR